MHMGGRNTTLSGATVTMANRVALPRGLTYLKMRSETALKIYGEYMSGAWRCRDPRNIFFSHLAGAIGTTN